MNAIFLKLINNLSVDKSISKYLSLIEPLVDHWGSLIMFDR